ncbi:MAG: MarR family winged helix-turn-helix transcriptional regulator [Chlamydiia bacterium]
MLKKKIQTSMGRDLYAASRWVRQLLDVKLKESTPFTADQAILMMVLQCDGTAVLPTLARDAGILLSTDISSLLQPLIDKKFIRNADGLLSMTETGSAALAQVWTIHESVERMVLEGVQKTDLEAFHRLIQQIFANCEKVVPFE